MTINTNAEPVVSGKIKWRFARLPLELIKGEAYRDLDPSDVLLYTLMLDRVSLSAANNWRDDEGRIYIYFTLDSIKDALHCGRTAAQQHKKKLLDKGLIRYDENDNKGKAQKIYVLPFYISDNIITDAKCTRGIENNTPAHTDNSAPPVPIAAPNQTENNNTDNNNNHLSIRDGYDGPTVRHIVMENIEYDILSERNYDMSTIDCIIDLIVDSISGKSDNIRIAGDFVSRNMVHSRFMKLRKEDIDYVLFCMNRNTSKIKNIKNYLLTALYNAPVTRSLYYKQLAQHDMPQLAVPLMKEGAAICK
ncbi:MAG: replication initiator protein A [Parasporobacterium sp.]|nr:replication initiator protein A [Parasporobacterium sp.]